MNRYAAALTVLLLAACAQAPTPAPPATDPVTPEPTPETPLVGQEVNWDLAPHANGIYAVGWTTLEAAGVPAGYAAGFIRKYDTAGALLWGKTFGIENAQYGATVASDAEGNAYVAGLNDSNLEPSETNDVFVRKFSPDGQQLWQRRFGSDQREAVGSIAVSSDAVYVVGATAGALAAEPSVSDAFIRAYATTGELLWTQQFGTPEIDYAYDVAVDDDGNAYVTGVFSTTWEGGEEDDNTFLRRYNPDGSLAWAKQVPYGEVQSISKVAVRGEDVYLGFNYLTKRSTEGFNTDTRLVRFDRDGNRDAFWAFDYDTDGASAISDLSTDQEGNVYFSGSTYAGPVSSGLVVKIDAQAVLVWEQKVALSDFTLVQALVPRTPDELYGTGTAYQRASNSNESFLRRFDGSNGDTVWNAAE